MRKIFIAVILCFFIVGFNAIPIAWNGGASGDWNVANNWLPTQVPGGSDQVTIANAATINIPSQSSADTITNTAVITLVVTGSSSFTVNNFTQGLAVTIQTDVGASFTTSQFFIFNGNKVTFNNFGSATVFPQVVGVVSQGQLTNLQQGNPVIFPGGTSKRYQINGLFYVPAGFQFLGGVQHQFQSLVTSEIQFGYSETIPSNGWSFFNDLGAVTNIRFNAGSTISGPVTVTTPAQINPRPTFTFSGINTVTQTNTMELNAVIGTGSAVSFNGAFTLTFNSLPPTFNTPNLQGTTTLTFNNQLAVPLTATFSDITINLPNLVFQNQWIFAGPGVTVTLATPQTFAFNATLTGVTLVFQKVATLNSGFVLLNGGSGAITFTDGIVANVQNNFTTFSPIFACSTPNRLFPISGTSQLIFPLGLTINGCTVTSTQTLSISGSLTTDGGNTTLPSNVAFSNSFQFLSNNNPANSLNSITLSNAINVPGTSIYTANAVEVISPAGTAANIGTTSVLTGSGIFTFNGGVSFSSGVTVGVKTAFPAGAISITASARVDWAGEVILRNTNLGGTGDIWFTGTITSTKGVSSITNPNFKLKQPASAFTLKYLYDGNLPDTGCQLIFSGTVGSRIIERDITALQNAGIVFDENVTFNTTASISTSGSPAGSVTFRNNGQTSATLSSSGPIISLGSNIFFNNTNFRFLGPGSFQFTSNPSIIYTQGTINSPSQNGDGVVTSVNALTVNLVASSTFGNSFIVNGALTTNDLDGNDFVISKKLTLGGLVSQTRTIQGQLNLGSNLTYTGNVIIASGATVNTLGSIEIQGNTITLQATAIWCNNIVLSQTNVIINAATAQQLTIGDQIPLHGFNIPSTLTVNSPVTLVLDGLFTANFQAAGAITGTGIVMVTNSFINSNAATSLTPQTLSLTNTTFTGTGAFTVAPVDSNLSIAQLVRAFIGTVYTGNTLTVNGATTISPLFTFNANPITINGGPLSISAGAFTVGSKIINNGAINFQGVTTLGLGASFAGAGALTFNNTVILTQNTFISNPVTFGYEKNIISVSNGGFVLTLNGTSVTVPGIVVSNGGSIVSTSPQFATQVISGKGVISQDWTWTNTVQFGALNITGARTINFNLILTNLATTYFVDGVTFNGGTFVPLVSSDIPVLGVEKTITTNVATTLSPSVTLTLSGTAFSFNGASTLNVNGTVNVIATVTFNSNVVFGYNVNPTASLPINFRVGTTGFLPSTASLQIYRDTINSEQIVATIFPSLTFNQDFTNINGPSGTSSLILANNIVIVGRFFTASQQVLLSPISITSQQNNTISGLIPIGTLTFISTTTPWVEPLVSFSGQLQQTLVLTGPIRMNNPTFGAGAQIVGPSRIAITNGLTVSNIFTFSAPVQLYVTAASGAFTFNLQGTATSLVFATTPSLFNPLGFNLVQAINIILTADVQTNVLKFNLNSVLALGDVTVSKGVLQLTSNSVTAGVVNVTGLATLWVDGTALTSQQLIFNNDPNGANPSNFVFTINSAAPTPVTTGTVVYKGVAQVNVVNSALPVNTAVTAITASSSNSPTANFLFVTGTPGFTYTSTRTGNNVAFSRSANPTNSPFPTQSNGPSPAVSSSSIVSINMIFLAIIFIFFIFN